MHAALIGRKLCHSISPKIHNIIGPYSYSTTELESESDVMAFLGRMKSGGDILNINVTIPYKETVIPVLDRISDTARNIGAVNTIISRGGKLHGFNTDLAGLLSMLNSAEIEISGKKALVLGSGGSSKTAVVALGILDATETVVISRIGENNYLNLDKHFDSDVIINTTPVGMYPNNGARLYITEDGQLKASDKSSLPKFPLERFKKLKACVDLIYNPAKTPFLLHAEELGIKAINGFQMLIAQAIRSRDIFLDDTEDDGEPFDLDEFPYIKELTDAFEIDNKSIGLISMPGCGKTSIGKRIAKLTKRRFIDIDEIIENKTGIKIPETFSKYGKKAFRDIESECISEASKESKCVIAYGGGSPLRKENRRLIRQNSTVILLERPIPLLARKKRPLTEKLSEEEMYRLNRARKPYYKAAADVTVFIDGDETVKESTDRILKLPCFKDLI
jgi:shikimate dehydrogenase